MIKTIRGKVISKTPPQLIVEVNGVGYGVFALLEVFDELALDSEVFLYTHHQVAEDKQQLFGFTNPEQLSFFEMLLTVSGVGPKSALAVVNSNRVDVLKAAIADGNAAVFGNASGIGKKTAERIIVDLKSKIGIQPDLASGYGDTYEVLSTLGYTANEIKTALSGLPSDLKDVQEQIKQALKALSK